jgi:hypothetical protein
VQCGLGVEWKKEETENKGRVVIINSRCGGLPGCTLISISHYSHGGLCYVPGIGPFLVNTAYVNRSKYSKPF